MNVKISQKHDNVYYIRKNYTLKSIYDDEKECINYTLSHTILVGAYNKKYMLNKISMLIFYTGRQRYNINKEEWGLVLQLGWMVKPFQEAMNYLIPKKYFCNIHYPNTYSKTLNTYSQPYSNFKYIFFHPQWSNYDMCSIFAQAISFKNIHQLHEWLTQGW